MTKLPALLLGFVLVSGAFAQDMKSTTPIPTAETPSDSVAKTSFKETPGLKLQVLLDRAHFGVGEIDGNVGSNTKKALKFFQESRGLPATGEADEATMAALDDGKPIMKTHTLTEEDVGGKYGGRPAYKNVEEKLAEMFEISPSFLKKMNPGAQFTAGQTITVPETNAPLAAGSVSKIVVKTTEKVLLAYDSSDKLIAMYPVTLGSDESIPYGEHTIKSSTKNPYYRRVMPGTGKIKAMNGGPNNYVGNMWMALSAKHYGIHGSPEPGKISKQESAGCIRLTNWSANELSKAIVKNAKVSVQK